MTERRDKFILNTSYALLAAVVLAGGYEIFERKIVEPLEEYSREQKETTEFYSEISRMHGENMEMIQGVVDSSAVQYTRLNSTADSVYSAVKDIADAVAEREKAAAKKDSLADTTVAR